MAKKKPEPVPADATDGAAKPVTQTAFRAHHELLLRQVDKFGLRTRHSRNMAMNILLEMALAAEGLWPPGDSD